MVTVMVDLCAKKDALLSSFKRAVGRTDGAGERGDLALTDW